MLKNFELLSIIVRVLMFNVVYTHLWDSYLENRLGKSIQYIIDYNMVMDQQYFVTLLFVLVLIYPMCYYLWSVPVFLKIRYGSMALLLFSLTCGLIFIITLFLLLQIEEKRMCSVEIDLMNLTIIWDFHNANRITARFDYIYFLKFFLYHAIDLFAIECTIQCQILLKGELKKLFYDKRTYMYYLARKEHDKIRVNLFKFKKWK